MKSDMKSGQKSGQKSNTKSGMKSNTKSNIKSNTKNEKAIISAIRSNPAISITEMCPITGLSRSGVQKIIYWCPLKMNNR